MFLTSLWFHRFLVNLSGYGNSDSLIQLPFFTSLLLGFDTETSRVRMKPLRMVLAQPTAGEGTHRPGSAQHLSFFHLVPSFLLLTPDPFLPLQECRSCCEGMICNVELPTNHTNAVFAVMHAQRTSSGSVPTPYLTVLACFFMLPLL